MNGGAVVLTQRFILDSPAETVRGELMRHATMGAVIILPVSEPPRAPVAPPDDDAP